MKINCFYWINCFEENDADLIILCFFYPVVPLTNELFVCLCVCGYSAFDALILATGCQSDENRINIINTKFLFLLAARLSFFKQKVIRQFHSWNAYLQI